MLQFILGASGFGKTHTIRRIAAQKATEGEKNIILLVPEQASFENEKALLQLAGAESAQNIKVLSFTRMADYVFLQMGEEQKIKLNSSGRNVLMHLAITQIKDNLTLYKNFCDKREMIDMMILSIKELKSNAISGRDLIKKADNTKKSVLKQKMQEVGLVASAYDALISRNYKDSLDDLTTLYEILLKNKFFEGYTLLVDEFDFFTPQQFKVLSQIIKQSKNCLVSLCLPANTMQNKDIQKSEIFSEVEKTLNNLICMANSNDIAVADAILLEHPHRFKNESLKALQQGFMQRKSNEESASLQPKELTIYEASDVYEECDFIARKIRQMVIEQNYRYKDFAIIARDPAPYQGVLDVAFTKYNIPFFIDSREDISNKPLIRLVVAAIEAAHKNFASSSVFEYAKTGLIGMTIEQISLLENYVFIWNIDKKEWLCDFYQNPAGWNAPYGPAEKEQLCLLNEYRQRIITPLIKFSKSIKQESGAAISEAIYNLLLNIDILKHLKQNADALMLKGEVNLAQEQYRLWDILIEVLEELALLLADDGDDAAGNQIVNSQKYKDLFKLAVSSSDIAFIPQGLDEVKVGAIDRIRPNDPKTVFVIGANEGNFPLTPELYGFFAKKDRREFSSMGIQLKDSIEDLILWEQFLMYKALTYASCELFVSYQKHDATGKKQAASLMINEIKSIFPSIKIIRSDEQSIEERVWAKSAAFEICAKNWNENTEFVESLKSYFKKDVKYRKKLEFLEKQRQNSNFKFKNITNAKSLFGSPLLISATQIDNYYKCSFQYFCKYGLLAKKRCRAEFGAMEYGNLMHYLLENILSQNLPQRLLSMQNTDLHQEINALISCYVQCEPGAQNAKFAYMMGQIGKAAFVITRHIAKELSQSEFIPTDFELPIRNSGKIAPLEIDVPDQGFVRVEGKIDRLDIMKKEGKTYARVIDYKTGKNDFRLSDILYGRNMQPLIYLLALLPNCDFTPAGVLYMPAITPTIKQIKGKDAKPEILKKLKMKGLVLGSPEVILGMEKEANGEFIPAKIKNGKFSSDSSVVSISEMDLIGKHIKSLIAKMAQNLYIGNIYPNPTKCDVCKYCDYSNMCGEEGNIFSEPLSFSNAETLNLLQN